MRGAEYDLNSLKWRRVIYNVNGRSGMSPGLLRNMSLDEPKIFTRQPKKKDTIVAQNVTTTIQNATRMTSNIPKVM